MVGKNKIEEGKDVAHIVAMTVSANSYQTHGTCHGARHVTCCILPNPPNKVCGLGAMMSTIANSFPLFCVRMTVESG